MKTLLSLLFLLGLTATLSAQTWEEKLEQMKKRVELRQQNQQARIDQQFSKQMRRVWIMRKLHDAATPPKLPDPPAPHVYEPDADQQTAPQDQAWRIVVDPEEEKALVSAPSAPQPLPEEARLSQPAETQLNRLAGHSELSFFGEYLGLRYDPGIARPFRTRPTEPAIADHWDALNETQHELLVYQLAEKARSLRLNDWGFCLLVNEFSRKLHPRDQNARNLFNWFVLSQADYVATVAYEGNDIFLMLPSQHTLYGRTFLRGKSHKFYALDLNGETVDLHQARVFDGKLPEADRVLNFSIQQAPRLASRDEYRDLKVQYQQRTYQVPIAINRNLIDFYQRYPFVDLRIYLSAPVSEPARASLVDSLSRIVAQLPATNGRSQEAEAVNFLLRFTQMAFEYQSDRDQFGGERYFFAEETLYYPYSDCEDRSVLFAYLVREILGLKVVGLIFPGHAATAVRFSRPVQGDHLTFRGDRYVICDPTYMQADLGKTLPEVVGMQARVVEF
jgi:hypothetical protein